MKISIIIPVYNASKYLKECLESILNQTHENYEILLIDDKSTDSSLEILTNFSKKDNRIKIYQLDRNLGAGSARNYGIRHATGEYLLFCDADDTYPTYSLQILANTAKKLLSDIVIGNITFMDKNMRCYLSTDSILNTLNIKSEKLLYNLKEPELWLPIYHQRCFISKKLLENNNITYPNLRRGQDPVFLASCFQAAKSIATIPHSIYNYRVYKTTSQSIYCNATFFDYLEHFKQTIYIY